MDKNFFRFDIDDAVSSVTPEELQNETPLNDNLMKKKEQKDKDFIGIISSKKSVTAVSKKGYEIKGGLEIQKEISSNILNVDDYVNFDFRQKNKLVTKTFGNDISKLSQEIDNKNIAFIDKEVAEVIQKTQIGIIFF